MQLLQGKTNEARSVIEKMRSILGTMAGDASIENEVNTLLGLLDRLEDTVTAESDAEAQARERAREIAAGLPVSDICADKELIAPFVSELVSQILLSASQAEQESRKQRQAEGIAAAKAKGVRFGREPKPLPVNFPQIVFRWRNGELSLRAAARECDMSTSAFSSAVKRLDEEGREAKTA